MKYYDVSSEQMLSLHKMVQFYGILRVKFKITGSQTIFCSWYFHACGGHSVTFNHLIIPVLLSAAKASSQSWSSMQLPTELEGLLLNSVNTQRKVQLHYKTTLRECNPQMWIMAKIIFFLSTAMIQYLFQLPTVSMDF